MAERTDIRPRLTLGSILLWMSFFLPFVVFNVQLEAQQLQATFMATGALLLLGFVISCWQDFRSKAPFSLGRLIYVVTMIIVYTIVTPVFMSAVVAARR